MWHAMGDQGYRDEEGRLWLLGRRHSVIHRPGGRIYPVPVEAAVEALPAVRRAALLDLPVLGRGETVEDRLVLALAPDEQGHKLPWLWIGGAAALAAGAAVLTYALASGPECICVTTGAACGGCP